MPDQVENPMSIIADDIVGLAALGESDAFGLKRVLRPREQVEFQLRQAILSGKFPPHMRLPSESELARHFGVSRSTIREALRSLATTGLVSTSPGATGGTFVEGVDHHALVDKLSEPIGNILQLGSLSHDELIEVRAIVEIPAARLAALHRTEAHLAELDQILDRAKLIPSSDPDVPGLHRSFHAVVSEASGNRLLGALVTALHSVTQPFPVTDAPEDARTSVKQHIKVVNAIRNQDALEAARAMEEHFAFLREHHAAAA